MCRRRAGIYRRLFPSPSFTPPLMLHLTNLPIELLTSIVSCLNQLDAEAAAKTFNKKVYAVCLPFIRERIAFLRHARAMSNLVGEGDIVGHTINCQMYAMAGLTKTYGAYDDEGLLPEIEDLDFLDLDGDMYWLEPTDADESYWSSSDPEEETEHSPSPDPEEHEGIDSGLVRLTQQASSLGLTVPDCFVRFMRSAGLRNRMVAHPRDLGFQLCVGPLRKVHFCRGSVCPRESYGRLADGDECKSPRDGYIVKFLEADNADDGYVRHYLLLFADGAHCVVGISGSESRWDDAWSDIGSDGTPLEAALDVLNIPYGAASDFKLSGHSAERFLAATYFSRWARHLLTSDVFAEQKKMSADGEACVQNSNWDEDDAEDHCNYCKDERTTAIALLLSDTEGPGGGHEPQPPILPSLPAHVSLYVGALYGLDGRKPSWRRRLCMRNMYPEVPTRHAS
jgi:hypothetical protein